MLLIPARTAIRVKTEVWTTFRWVQTWPIFVKENSAPPVVRWCETRSAAIQYARHAEWAKCTDHYQWKLRCWWLAWEIDCHRNSIWEQWTIYSASFSIEKSIFPLHGEHYHERIDLHRIEFERRSSRALFVYFPDQRGSTCHRRICNGNPSRQIEIDSADQTEQRPERLFNRSNVDERKDSLEKSFAQIFWWTITREDQF